MRMRIGALILQSTVALLAVGVVLGAAQAQEADPPGRVARLSDAEGSVSLQPAGAQEWIAAQVNRPLTTADKLWSDQNSRAELDVGGAVIRLGSGTGFSFFNLDDRTAQMQLTAGTLIVRVRDLQDGQLYEIDTPNLTIALLEPGEYRIEVNDAGDLTVVKVSQGSAQADFGGRSVTVGMQQMARFGGTQALTYEGGTLTAPDDFDAWSAARDRGLLGSPSSAYVAADVPGTQDLDNNGVWQSTPDYGYVWTPTVVAMVGWAPYRFGHWAWIAPWGWTWIDDLPWGFAPYHYGRWVVWNSTWCWVPGPRRARPVYAPAVVGWVGGGPGRGASGTPAPHVGWFPLGPREVYVPAYTASTGYLRRVNVTNTYVNSTYVENVYQNNSSNIRYVNNTAGAVTAVSQDAFTSGERVNAHGVRVSSALLADAAVSATTPPITPLRQSVLGPTPARSVARPPSAYLNRPVLVRTPPPRAPVPLEKQLAAVQANGGRALPAAELARLQPPAAAAPVRVLPGAPPGRPAANSAASANPDALPNFAERQHALESSSLPSAPRQSTYSAPPAVPAEVPRASGDSSSARAAREQRSDWPPAAQPPAVSSAAGSAGRPARVPAPVPAPPAGEHYRAPAPPAAVHSVTAPPVSHPPPTPRAQPPSPREGAVHADTERAAH